ncbi:hypothetical protein [Aquimarina atlantica]|uniref:hypothetical protein n=1 Tax=Aquimarina atlantica TaxID=1317122 RepID=UPI000A59349D|nr:hypothetical protein [Aquimarina atlantica]
MKKILNLGGVSLLSKNDQSQILGSRSGTPCFQNGNQCCRETGNGSLCGAGQCLPNGYCVYS